MGFTILFLVAWLLVVIALTMNKKLTLAENTFVFLLILVLNINWSWIAFEEMNLVGISQQPLQNTAFLINRSITIPVVILIAMNLMRRARSIGSQLLTAVLSVVLLEAITATARYYGIVKFIRWNYGYDVVYYLVLLAIAYLLLSAFDRAGERGVQRT
ncbi:hypothetical protein [Cohnella candidum]|uniref:Uncharacterized protein n=1 Tax=Cohnella candidum TaxID=2674991 RepID=A0A3G3K392_9BACL|nr:hypothetical protein [Cohnella candidum]AYQ74928.1 hypothetical protein EAV92_21655 [Cohnella candidum]